MKFWRFEHPNELSVPLESSYHVPLVLLSIVVASLAALAALAVVDRIQVLRSRDGRPQHMWLLVGAFAMGSGIWAMHFTGMLAYRLPVKMSYSLVATAVSMVPAMVGSWFALRSMSHDSVAWWRLQLGGLVMAVGIGTMHYTGMEAMILDALMRYRFSLFVLSIIVAHVLATAALYVRFVARRRSRKRGAGTRIVSALVMGNAVAGMHYTAMAAVRFYPSPPRVVPDMLMSPELMAIVIAIVVLLITGLTVLGTFIDQRLTEASDSVVEAATRYESVLATMADGFIVLNEDQTIETFNAAAEKIFGCSADDVYGQRLDSLIDEGEQNVVQYYDKTGDSYLMNLGAELQGRRRASGELFPIDLAVSSMVLRGRRLYTCTVRDVAEKRALEHQLSQSQKLESIGQLAAGIAHEINTPTQYVGDNTRFLHDAFNDLLSPVKKLADALRRESNSDAVEPEALHNVKTALDEADVDYLIAEIPQAIQQSLDGVDRVAKIVRAMKEFSHPATEKSAIDINRAIESTITVATNEWKYVADVQTELDSELPHVPCLPGDFNQAILNIIVNAAHAIAEAKGDARDDKGHILVSTRKLGEWAEIRIRDDGPGIPPEHQKKIFDPFFTTKDVGKGTGQGLSIARNTIVKKHHGTLSVDSRPGEGTCFIIQLPIEHHTTTKDDVKVPA